MALSGAMANTVFTFENAIKDAEKLVSLNNNWKIMRGNGKSMLPFYGENTILIVETTAYHKLGKGMSVVYRDNQGDLVGHTLRVKIGNEWYAQGFNNKNQDPQMVTERNFVGVIFGVISGEKSSEESIWNGSSSSFPTVHGKKY